MNQKIILSLGVIFVLTLAVMVSCVLTASDVKSSGVSLKDVNSDGFVDVVDSEEGIFWNQGNNQYNNNEMILTDYDLTKEGFGSYYAHQDPVNATSLNHKPSFFVFSHIHIDSERGHIADIYNMSTTFYEKNSEGTYLPTRAINPNMDFNLFLHVTGLPYLDKYSIGNPFM